MATYHYTDTTAHARRLRVLIRRVAGCPGKPYRVILVDGAGRPKLVGEGYYWTTPSGKTVVCHPNAYRWPTKYWPSTLRIEVGTEWAHRAGLLLRCLQAAGRRRWREVAKGIIKGGNQGSIRFDGEGKFRRGDEGN